MLPVKQNIAGSPGQFKKEQMWINKKNIII